MTMQFTRAFANKSSFTGNVLTEDRMRSIAPSIFAEAAHESRSARYAYIPTIDVVRAMHREGFQAVTCRQSSPRDEGRIAHTKHMVRFRKADLEVRVGDVIPELILVNSHDGSSSYQLMAGMWRTRCLNGLVVQVGTLDDLRIRHGGDVIGKVIEGSYSVIDQSLKALAAPQDWSQINVSTDARQAFAEAAHVLRFGDAEGNVDTPIKPHQLLLPRRQDDHARDLWTTFNVAQENVIRGGLSAVGRDANGRPRRSTTRQVNGIDQDVKLNKALWTLTERMASILKGA